MKDKIHTIFILLAIEFQKWEEKVSVKFIEGKKEIERMNEDGSLIRLLITLHKELLLFIYFWVCGSQTKKF